MTPIVVEPAKPSSGPISDLHNNEQITCTLGKVPIGGPVTKKALLFSLWDGAFANGMVALVDTFAVAAAVYLKAPAIAIALLSGLPLLLSSIGQFFLPFITNPSRGRKRYVLVGAFSQSAALLLLACSGWLPENLRSWAFVLFFTLYGFSGTIISGFWIAWMGDLVPSNVRGRHFAWRNRIFSSIQLLCTIGAGFIARKYSADTASWVLFATIFFIAGTFRYTSAQLLFFQHEPPILVKREKGFSLSVLRTMKPFLFFCIASGLMQGAVAFCAPFFNVWYVRDLHFNFFTLSILAAATVVGTIVSLPLWGKLCDSIGNRKVLLITGFLVATVPFPYVISEHAWQIFLLNLYTGISWGGFNLSNFNYILIGSGKENSEKKIMLSVAASGLCVFTFGLLGGYAATRLPVIFHYQLSSLFFVSGLLRTSVFLLFFLRIPKFETETFSRIFQLKKPDHSDPVSIP